MISGINTYSNYDTQQSLSSTRSGTTESTSPSGWDGANTSASVSSSGGMLTMMDFYTLLAAQLRYQDADNPMDTSEMMGQMVQTQMMQTISQLSEVMITSYAASMAGREVTVAEVDGTGTFTGESTVGTVEGVYLAGSSPVLIVNGKAYSMSQLMVVGRMPETGDVGDVPEDEEDADKVPEEGTGGVTDEEDADKIPEEGTEGTEGIPDGEDTVTNPGGEDTGKVPEEGTGGVTDGGSTGEIPGEGTEGTEGTPDGENTGKAPQEGGDAAGEVEGSEEEMGPDTLNPAMEALLRSSLG